MKSKRIFFHDWTKQSYWCIDHNHLHMPPLQKVRRWKWLQLPPTFLSFYIYVVLTGGNKEAGTKQKTEKILGLRSNSGTHQIYFGRLKLFTTYKPPETLEMRCSRIFYRRFQCHVSRKRCLLKISSIWLNMIAGKLEWKFVALRCYSNFSGRVWIMHWSVSYVQKYISQTKPMLSKVKLLLYWTQKHGKD